MTAPNVTAIAVINEYPPEQYNLLIPVKTIQEISPLHKVIVNVVTIDNDPKNKDVYAQKSEGGKPSELALTKKGLAKLMSAANIQVLDSRPVPTQQCNKCYQMAQATRLAPKCFECPHKDDVAYQVTIAVPDPSGTYRVIKATKEIRISDEKAKMSDAQFKQFFPYRTEHCETKALNRALREGLMVSSTYRPEELTKPFAVALVVPNMSDPDLKRAMVEKLSGATASLYGNTVDHAQLPSAETITIGPDDPDDFIDIGVDDDLPPWEEPAQNSGPTQPACEECGSIIMPTGNWSEGAIVDYSLQRFGKIMCPDCQKAQRATRRAGGRQ